MWMLTVAACTAFLTNGDQRQARQAGIVRADAQVCAGTSADVAPMDRMTVEGTVVEPWTSIPDDFDNLLPCWTQGREGLVIQDDEGERWFVSYAWLDDGMDVTPTAAVMSGDRVTLLLARGGGESGGFTLRDEQGSLLYAMEMGRGGSALRDEDVGVQVVAQEGPVADISTLNMQAPDDRVHLLPGEDKTLMVEDRFMMACNIDSHDDEETSWVLVY